jgi:hypothetical protein
MKPVGLQKEVVDRIYRINRMKKSSLSCRSFDPVHPVRIPALVFED